MREQNVANIVQQRMEAKGWTAYRLAMEAKITRQTVGNFIVRGRPITSDKLMKVLAALDLIVTTKEQE